MKIQDQNLRPISFQLSGRLFEITGGWEHVAVANGGHRDDRPPGNVLVFSRHLSLTLDNSDLKPKRLQFIIFASQYLPK